MAPELNSTELLALDALLAGDDPVLDSLRRCRRSWQMVRRVWTGSGCLTYLAAEGERATESTERFLIDDVGGKLGGIPCEFLLFVRENGRAALLDCMTYEGENIHEGLRLDGPHYLYTSNPAVRDLDYVRGKWATTGGVWNLG